MLDKPTLSIIIPVYNIAPYLTTAVHSVLDQTFTDYEILLVNDGSTDGSGSLCESLAWEDSRIRVVHQEHLGTSAARNAGIEASRGAFIGFVDGDDWIEPDMYAILYENSVTYDAELSACGFIKITDPQALAFTSKKTIPQSYTPEEAIEALFKSNHMRYSACNKLFHRTLFEGIRFPQGRLMEDKATIYHLIHRCQQIVWCPAPMYHYFMRPDSAMHSKTVQQQQDLILANSELLAFVRHHYPSLLHIAEKCCQDELKRLHV